MPFPARTLGVGVVARDAPEVVQGEAQPEAEHDHPQGQGQQQNQQQAPGQMGQQGTLPNDQPSDPQSAQTS